MDNETDRLINNYHDDNEELTGCGASLPCDPRRRLHRYLVLILICFLSFGSYFCYDNPAAMQDIMTKDLKITVTQYMNFYAWYSWPNVVLSVAGGFLIDRVFGIRLGALIFGGFVLVGQLLFATGAYINTIYLMYFARFVFGIGGESLAVSQNTYAASWFDDSELNFIFGLQLSMSRIGSTVNMNTMQKLYYAILPNYPVVNQCLGVALFIASVTCLVSLGCALTLAYFDRRAKRILGRDAAATGEVIKLSDIRYFPAALWIICIICVAYYVAVFPFISLGLVFFERKYDFSADKANMANSLVYILSAAASPVAGFLIDMTGRNLYWVFMGIMTTMGCHMLFAFTTLNPFVITVLLGLSYSILASSLWPMVAYVVPPHQRATAYGIMQAVQNLGLGVISIIAGVIVDSYGYLMLEVFFMVWLCVALLATVFLYLWDVAAGNKLNESGKSRKSKDIAISDSFEPTINT